MLHNSGDETAFTKFVFVRLDPSIRRLCDAVKEYTTTYSRDRRLELLRNMADTAEQLQSMLDAIREAGPKLFSFALSTIQDFLTLPLRAILRKCGPESCQSTLKVEQSALWKCVEQTTRLLNLIVHSIEQRHHDNSKLESYLVSCATALPSGEQVQHLRSGLDTGDACYETLFDTIRTLLQKLTKELDESLLVRILDTAVALIEPSETTTTPHYETQLAALDTMQALLIAYSDRDPWRRVFPGVYAGIYRRVLHSIRIAHNQQGARRVVVLSTSVLASLLGSILATNGTMATKKEPSVLEQLQALSIAAKSKPEAKSDSPATTPVADALSESERFIRQVNQRLPATLTVLLNMLTVARSPAIRKSTLALARVLLIKEGSCWGAEIKESLTTKALESCLVLTKDTDDQVVADAESLVSSYSSNPASRHDMDNVIVSQVFALLEKLPSLAQSSREMELQANLKLISGYLHLQQRPQSDSTFPLQTAVTAEGAALTIRKAFGTLFDVNFDPADLGRAIIVAIGDDSSTKAAFPHQYHSYRYLLQDETLELGRKLVQQFGSLLGPKHAVIFVDACVADLYSSSLERIKRKASLEGHSQVQWLHEWVGVVGLSQEILTGGFSATTEPKQLRYLTSLTQSVLPILTTHPLWNLPLVCRSPTTNANEDTSGIVAAAALRGNAALTCALLGFIGSTVRLLDQAVERFAPILLYSILEKAGSRTSTDVQHSAVSCLNTLATSIGAEDSSELILAHMESSLIASMRGKIRVPGGRSLSIDERLDDTLMTVIDVATTMLRIAAKKSREEGMDECDAKIISSVEMLTLELTMRFDHSSTVVSGDADATLQFLQLFDSAIQFLWTRRHCETKPIPSSDANPVSEPWFDLLAEFKTQVGPVMSPAEGFAIHWKEQERHIEAGKQTTSVEYPGLARDTDFVAKVAWRCDYLLSHASLQVQIQSCTVLECCFGFLKWVAEVGAADSDQSNGPKTAVLRQIHSSWTAISTRLRALTDTVTLSTNTSLLVVEPSSTQPRAAMVGLGEQRIFLAKLLRLIGTMTESADDFMASRLRNSVWPCVCKIVENYGDKATQSKCPTQPRIALETRRTSRQNAALSESERNLLQSAIELWKRVYDHRATGVVLSGLIPSAGALLFPFLDYDDDDSIAATAVEALTSMIRIDYDALWRPLVEMSDQRLRPCPLKVQATAQTHQPVPRRSKSDLARQRARHLVALIDSLPEQPLE